MTTIKRLNLRSLLCSLILVVQVGVIASPAISFAEENKKNASKTDTIAPGPVADDTPINPKPSNSQNKKTTTSRKK